MRLDIKDAVSECIGAVLDEVIFTDYCDQLDESSFF
jgi:hypothetical protein